MKLRKWICVILIFSIVFLYVRPVFADDEDSEEYIDASWIYEEVETASSVVSDEPVINSRAAVVYDRSTGYVVWGKDENSKRKMASTTKIMTGIIVIEQVEDLSQIVTISKKAGGVGGSRLRAKSRG